MTKKLYEDNVYLASCTAEVVEVDENMYVFDQTIFFPVGGGQSADKGTIDGIDVIDVKEDGKAIKHYLAEPLKNTSVKMQLDWSARLDQMQQHCGEHILSGVIKKMYNGNNKGFHIGTDYVTIDIDTEIKSDMLYNIENEANTAIYQNIELKISTLDEESDLPLRKEPTVLEDIRVVNIPGVDCVACCGTHPTRTGDVGIIKLFKVEKNKGMSRIFFKCGMRALSDLSKKTDIVQTLNRHYSTDDQTLLERFDAEQERFNQLKASFIKLNRTVIDGKIDDMVDKNAKKQILKFEELNNQDMNYVVKKVTDQVKAVVLILSLSEKKIILTHDGSFDVKCNVLFSTIKSYHGKGGGSPKSAQGKFDNHEEAINFFNYLESELGDL